MTNVLVAGWIGSTNLGDELVFAGLRAHLTALGATPVPVTVDPVATLGAHGTPGVAPRQPLRLWRAAGAVDLAVLGGGGLIQDETSPANLPYHLARLLPVEVRSVPWAGLGLGVGRLRRRVSRWLARRLRAAAAVTVRDGASRRSLARLGVPDVTVTGDLALALGPVDVAPADRLVVCLRAWSGAGTRLPAGLRRMATATPEWFVDGAAAALDEAAGRTGLEVTFVTLQADRDEPVHRRVAARMHTPVTCATAGLEDLPDALAAGRAVVTMRYHGAIGALLGARPAVLVDYSPKMAALAADLGRAGALVDWSPQGLTRLGAAVEGVLDLHGAARRARSRLTDRERTNRRVLARLLG